MGFNPFFIRSAFETCQLNIASPRYLGFNPFFIRSAFETSR